MVLEAVVMRLLSRLLIRLLIRLLSRLLIRLLSEPLSLRGLLSWRQLCWGQLCWRQLCWGHNLLLGSSQQKLLAAQVQMLRISCWLRRLLRRSTTKLEPMLAPTFFINSS